MQTVYTVHTAEKPARPVLSIGMSLLGLGVSLALAAGLVRFKRASAEIILGDRFAPPGWDLSFQVPAGWESQTLMVPWLSSPGYLFSEPEGRGTGRSLLILREDGSPCQPAVSAAQIFVPFWAAHTLRASGIGPVLQMGNPRIGPFGALPGAEVEFRLATGGGVARVGLQSDGTCIGAVLFTKGHGPSRRHARPLEQIAESFRRRERVSEPESTQRISFRVPSGTIVERLEGAVLPRYRIRPDRGRAESWDILLAETWLIGERSPQELLEDLARVHRQRADPGGERVEFGRGNRSGLRLNLSQVHELGAIFCYAIMSLREGRALVAIAGCTPPDRPSLDRILEEVFAHYEPGAVESGTPAEAEAAGRELIRRLQREITRRQQTGTRQDWSLLYGMGQFQGFALTSVAVVEDKAGRALHVRQSYVLDTAGRSSNGRYEARLTPETIGYALEDRSEGTYTTIPVRTQWHESTHGDGEVSRSLTINEQQIRSRFSPGDLFVPQPALEMVAYLAARGDRAAALLSTAGHLAETVCGFLLQPVPPSVLQEEDDGLSPRVPVACAVLVSTDCRPNSFELLGFDRNGILVKALYGGTITAVACAPEEVLSHFPDARTKLARWDD